MAYIIIFLEDYSLKLTIMKRTITIAIFYIFIMFSCKSHKNESLFITLKYENYNNTNLLILECVNNQGNPIYIPFLNSIPIDSVRILLSDGRSINRDYVFNDAQDYIRKERLKIKSKLRLLECRTL